MSSPASSKHALSRHLRSLYRSLLRELPPRPLSTPSPLQRSLRQYLSRPLAGGSGSSSTDDVNPNASLRSPSSSASSSSSDSSPLSLLSPAMKKSFQQVEQYLHFVRAQRMYTTLLERYNPGMGMDEEERVRLTARRVGMDLPAEFGRGGGERGEGGS
ncbi:MAG: hypothetical protein M1837_004225 [Sclerophora amabilis]|nr:MAG: hypothetical protein M1837_004225 [Sclerophora amabilis]